MKKRNVTRYVFIYFGAAANHEEPRFLLVKDSVPMMYIVGMIWARKQAAEIARALQNTSYRRRARGNGTPRDVRSLNIGAIRPLRAYIVPPYALKVHTPYLATSRYAVVSRFL